MKKEKYKTLKKLGILTAKKPLKNCERYAQWNAKNDKNKRLEVTE